MEAEHDERLSARRLRQQEPMDVTPEVEDL